MILQISLRLPLLSPAVDHDGDLVLLGAQQVTKTASMAIGEEVALAPEANTRFQSVYALTAKGTAFTHARPSSW